MVTYECGRDLAWGKTGRVALGNSMLILMDFAVIDTTLETMSKTQRKKLEKQLAIEGGENRQEGEGNSDEDMVVE